MKNLSTFAFTTYIFRLVLLLASKHRLAQLVDGRVQLFFVLESKFFVDDLNIANGIDITLHVNDIIIFECT